MSSIIPALEAVSGLTASAEYVRSMWEAIGTIVMGRNLFDLVNGWEGHPPTGDHVVVVSHRPKPEGWHPEASYHFVDDVRAAIDKAQEPRGTNHQCERRRSGQRDPRGRPGERGGDGRGTSGVRIRQRYFGSIDGQHRLEDPHVVIQGDRVLHLRFSHAARPRWGAKSLPGRCVGEPRHHVVPFPR